MTENLPISKALNLELHDKKIEAVNINDKNNINIKFSDGSVLNLEANASGLLASIDNSTRKFKILNDSEQPTQRQLEYLSFLNFYIKRYGQAPAESDIQKHFLVSPPTVNQMMQTLEKRGFITRQAGVARSIKMCIELNT